MTEGFRWGEQVEVVNPSHPFYGKVGDIKLLDAGGQTLLVEFGMFREWVEIYDVVKYNIIEDFSESTRQELRNMNTHPKFNPRDHVFVTFAGSKRHGESAEVVSTFPVTDEYTIRFFSDGYTMRIDGFKLAKITDKHNDAQNETGIYPAIAAILMGGDIVSVFNDNDDDVCFVEDEKELKQVINETFAWDEIEEVRLFPLSKSVSANMDYTFTYTPTDGG